MIVGGGGQAAAHLGGVVAAYTPNPVITVPMKTSDLGRLDSLLSMVQMPSGVPWPASPSTARRTRPSWPCKSSAPAATPDRQKIIDFKRGQWPTRRRRVLLERLQRAAGCDLHPAALFLLGTLALPRVSDA